jgi:hypothetical protein
MAGLESYSAETGKTTPCFQTAAWAEETDNKAAATDVNRRVLSKLMKLPQSLLPEWEEHQLRWHFPSWQPCLDLSRHECSAARCYFDHLAIRVGTPEEKVSKKYRSPRKEYQTSFTSVTAKAKSLWRSSQSHDSRTSSNIGKSWIAALRSQ